MGNLKGAVCSLSELYYQQNTRSCRLIILLDDLHRGLGHDTLSELVSVLNPLVSPDDTIVNVSLVLAGELPLEQEFRKDVSSLRALISTTRELSHLGSNDVATLVELAEDYGWSVEQGCDDVLFVLTKGYPYKLHYYLFTALDRYKQINRTILQTISEDPDTQKYLSAVLKQHSASFKKSGVMEIFYSYAQQDQSWLIQLEQHFSLLRKQKKIRDWHVGKVKPGQEPAKQISKHFDQADIILLLISPDYIGTESLIEEAQRAVDRYLADTAVVIPIRLRPIANWKDAPFGDLQALPKFEKWLNELADASSLLAEIVEEINAIVMKLREL